MCFFLSRAAGAAAFLILVKLLTAIKPVKIIILKRAAAWAEDRYRTEEKSGARKKQFVFYVTRWLLMGADNATSWLIDAIVAAANDQQTDMSLALRRVTAGAVAEKLAAIKTKLSGEELS